MVRSALVLTASGHYLHWGWFSIGLTNFLIILGMIVVFVLALVVPFPAGAAHDVPPGNPR